ncbi:MAG: chemotaxis protein CheW [Dehalococcoidia bacterium]
MVVLSLAGERYGVEVEHVREVALIETMTMTESAADGLVRLHGADVPVVDLRRQLAIQAEDESEGRSILVAEIDGRAVGLIVDAVTGVLRIRAGAVRPAPVSTSPVDSNRLAGVTGVEDDLLWLLDVGKVFTRREKAALFSVPSDSD